MPDIPTLPSNDNSTDDDQPQLQGYQDDFDTAQKDQFASEAGSNPVDDTPATRAELRKGLNESAGDEPEVGTHASDFDNPEPPMAERDDYREEIEDRNQDGPDVGGDNEGHSTAPWQ